MNPPILSPPMPVLRGHAGPNHLTSLRFSDGRQRVVLDGELPQVGGCVEVLGTVAVNSTGDVFSVRLPGGGGGNVGLANLLQLRASPQAAPLQAGPADPDTPQPGQPTHTSGDGGLPRFTFFVHDHLGNSRVLYANKLAGCGSAQARYVLEHVLDYYPYGRTLREHAVAWERFQTTHHERDPETGLDYWGARFYDGDVPRFLSTDPKAHEYADLSPYNYVANNPIRFIDPDGRNIVVPLTGEKLGGQNTREYQKTVIIHLQSLTNDVLGWGRDDSGRDIITIVKQGGANTDKDLGFGTALISSLIESSDKHAFIEAPGSDLRMQENVTTAFSTEANLNTDGTAGAGSSSWIRFNPNDTQGGMNTDGNTGRPANIGLAHELIHAAINMGGINIDTPTHIESDPNDNQGGTISRTEFVTRFLENFVRQEQGEPLRVLPNGNN